MSGPELRAAMAQPLGVRLLILAVGVTFGVGVGILGGRAGWAAPVALAVYLAAVVVLTVVLRRYVTARRRRLGLVEISRSQFDLVMAVGKVSPEHVAEGRALHDALLSAIRRGDRREEVAAIEARMGELAGRTAGA
jgi:membrane protein implicated in regulation of membrane protease activity